MGRTQKTKNSKHQTAVIAPKPYSDMPFGPATVVPNKKRTSTKTRKQATRQTFLKECSSTLKHNSQRFPPRSRSVSRDQGAKPHLPLPLSIIEYVFPAKFIEDANTIAPRQIFDLSWMFDGQMWYHNQAWRTVEENRRNEIKIQELLPGIQSSWAHAPTLCPLRAIDAYLQHLNDVWKAWSPLQIPDSWSVFENVNWELNGCFQASPTDSEPNLSPYVSSGSSGSPPESSNTSSRPQRCKTIISCRGRHLIRSRARGYWNTIATMTPEKFAWKRQTEERAVRRDQTRHTGHVDFNQQARNHDMWPQHSFPSLISHCDANCYKELLLTVHELSTPQTLGRWMAGVVETELFPARRGQPARWPSRLMNTNQPVVVDYTCRATPHSIGWHEDMCPLLFAAQFDPDDDFNQHGPHSVAHGLASVFQPMMIIFILYYLDIRLSTDDPMPPWMVLFGIYYNENGVVIWGHYPCFQPSIESRPDIFSGWRATSSIIETTHRWTMLESPQRRGPLLSTLNRIQGHCVYVLERLRAWEGYQSACQLLMA